jgi:hypothetical protein
MYQHQESERTQMTVPHQDKEEKKDIQAAAEEEDLSKQTSNRAIEG